MCHYLSASLGERGRCTSAEGRLISGQFKKWWLRLLCNSLGEALEASIDRGRLRRRGAIDVVRRRHDRPTGRVAASASGVMASTLLACRSRGGVTTEASPSSPRRSSPENGCPPTTLRPPGTRSPEPASIQSPVLQLAGSRRARRRAPPAFGRPTPKARAHAQLQQQRVIAQGRVCNSRDGTIVGVVGRRGQAGVPRRLTPATPASSSNSPGTPCSTLHNPV
jgi:hypothetical protein